MRIDGYSYGFDLKFDGQGGLNAIYQRKGGGLSSYLESRHVGPQCRSQFDILILLKIINHLVKDA